MKLVIAGNYAEFRRYLNETRGALARTSQARYVSRPEQVMGCRGAEVVLYGQYWLNPLYKKLGLVRAWTEK